MLAVLDSMGADRLVIGHTPTPLRRILKRFGGRPLKVNLTFDDFCGQFFKFWNVFFQGRCQGKTGKG